jgi:Phage major tail protein 2.
MATIKGQNLRVFMENGSGHYSVIAAAQQCDLSLRLNVKTSSTKDDTDDWNVATVVNLTWEIRTQGLVAIDPERNDTASLLDRVGQTVRVELATASGEQNSDVGEMMLAGDAIISDISINAQVDEESTYNVTLTGKKNMLTDIRLIMTSDQHYVRTTDGNLVAAEHEEI